MDAAMRQTLVRLIPCVLAPATLLNVIGNRPTTRAAGGDEVESTFGRPVNDGEQTNGDWRLEGRVQSVVPPVERPVAVEMLPAGPSSEKEDRITL
jgi:hypothetical protein